MDINADLGEGCDYDAELMSVITSCNIACGGHAGDDTSMRNSLILAQNNGVAAGAHPSFPDRENFGRTKSNLSGERLESSLRLQVQNLKHLATQFGVSLTHLKPHGALYNMAAREAELAASVALVVAEVLPHARLVGPPGSQLQAIAIARGLDFVAEGFADRAYDDDGQLRDRKKEGAILQSSSDQVEQALEIALRRTVTTYQGSSISLPANTICVHGDTPGAFEAAEAIRAAMHANEIAICAPG